MQEPAAKPKHPRPNRLVIPTKMFLADRPSEEEALRGMNGGTLPEAVLIEHGEFSPYIYRG
jgi:hypothetical protein